ncbi:MAG: hypothetical protein GY845_35095 [Planctomycetes bacterium]|nr:hypothetical protein [Planctomycetota bacterium]
MNSPKCLLVNLWIGTGMTPDGVFFEGSQGQPASRLLFFYTMVVEKGGVTVVGQCS